jgi:hypothetical protein
LYGRECECATGIGIGIGYNESNPACAGDQSEAKEGKHEAESPTKARRHPKITYFS